MAALSHFASLSSLDHSRTSTSSFRLFFLSHHHRLCNAQSSILCLAASKKSRPSRKLMSDDELRNVLREFVGTVGLPHGHVPSTKDLSRHGRKDLANIVRRRGHKLIKELLSSSTETATDGFASLEKLNSNSIRNYDHEETGQIEGKLDDMIEEQMDITVNDVNSEIGTSLSLSDDAIIVDSESPVSEEPTLSLQEKVQNFMKYGQLDTVEENVYGDSNFNEGSTILNDEQQSSVDGEREIHDEGDMRHVAHVSSDNGGQNGTLLLPRLMTSDMEHKFMSRDIISSARGTEYTDLDNLLTQAGERENELEIIRLKRLLYQKELELSRLKEEVEKEKQTLLVLQTKAEDEITKAQKLISEKDAELLAAEESLSGLVEAKIQYSGEGEMVEVSGSFNGWHQRIKMDPQPSSSMLGPFESRNSRLWSTTLWLYPGTYEIKFIVDGHWKIDPQKEITSKGVVENNILRVDR